MAQDVYVPQPGDIGLVRITGAGGFLIRVGQWLNGDGFADYEHAFVVVDGGELVEAEPGGARVRPLSEYDGLDVVWLRCPPQYGAAVARIARAMEGTPYNWYDYLYLALYRFHFRPQWLKRAIQDDEELICSQLCDLAASRGGWHIFSDGRLPQNVTPGDLARVVEASSGI